MVFQNVSSVIYHGSAHARYTDVVHGENQNEKRNINTTVTPEQCL